VPSSFRQNGDVISLTTGYRASSIGQAELQPANDDSWAWTFTKSFFGRLVSAEGWKAVGRSIVDENGCDRLVFETFAGDFNPHPDESMSASDVAELAPKAAGAAGLARASLYSASKGLTVPLRSGVYRGLRGQALR